MFNISNGRNYKTEVFYDEDDKEFLRLEYDADFNNNGVKETGHVIYHKIDLNDLKVERKNINNERTATICFNLLPNSLDNLFSIAIID